MSGEPESPLLAGGRSSKSKGPPDPESVLPAGGRSSKSRDPFRASFPGERTSGSCKHPSQQRPQLRYQPGPPLAAMQSQCPKLSATTRGTRTRGVERVCPLLSHSGTPSGVSISHPSSPHAAAVHHRAWLVRAVTNTPARRAAAQCSPDSDAASPTTASGGRRCSYCAVLVRSGTQTQAPGFPAHAPARSRTARPRPSQAAFQGLCEVISGSSR